MARRLRQDDASQLDLFSLGASWRAAVLEPEARAVEETAKALPIVPLPAPEPERIARNIRNYRITDEDKLGRGGLRAKCRGNIAAIEILKHLEKAGREATEDHRSLLVRYVGWGGLPQVFDPQNEEWEKEREELAALLTPEELESARASTLNAHYTSPVLVRAVYAGLERLGFQQGRILEPSCGIGHFIGLLPESMHRHSIITGIEIDALSARMAKVLYPDADIRHEPFEKSKLADGFYDVAVSNIPFGDYAPYDPRYKQWKFPIHDYYFAATLDKVRPGGLIAFITSRGTMDKVDGSLREYVSQQADLLGAIRLPNTAFKKNAHTEVTTDLVFLRKRRNGEAPAGQVWRELQTITNSLGETMAVNEFFAAHPEQMLGEMRLSGRMYRNGEPTLVETDREWEQRLSGLIQSLPEKVFVEENRVVVPVSEAARFLDEVKPHAYTLVNGELYVRESESLRKAGGISATTLKRIRGLVQLREAVRACLGAQREDKGDEEILLTREQLNHAYDRFVSKFGPVSKPVNVAAFRGDPDLPLLLSLERYDRESGKAEKAAIFRERTVRAPPPPPVITSARDALLVTLNARGRVELEHLCALLGKTQDEVVGELSGAAFLDPQSQRWETEDAYLSGNVREKLQAAEAAALVEPKYQGNVEALQAVQPADLSPSEIDARLGSTWIPSEDIQQFAAELLQENGIAVRHSPELGLWLVQAGWTAKGSLANTTQWGTQRRTALDLIEDALNLRTPTVYDQDTVTEKDVINIPETEAARDKQEKIKERFKEWIWNNDERSERLARLYNDTFNTTRLRTYNGDHLTLPGASAAIVLKPHQKAAVWRILQNRNTLLAHVVGAGKTYTMVAAAMELKRLGLARKSLFVVPNHMLGQFSSELLTLYPGANILVAGKEDFEKTKRQTLMSRIATGHWDAIIVTHASFEKVPVSQETQEAFFQEQLDEITLALRQHREDSRMVKILERTKKRLQAQMEALLGVERKDDGLTFEELGIDRLFVDEAHHFKNLFYVTKMTRIAGLPQSASQRALDMFLKISHLRKTGGGVVFATGTPIANSVAEMFTLQRYLQMELLQSLELSHFDAWAATFGEPVTAMELAPDGSGYRLHTRFARFINVPELMQQFRQAADIQTQAMLNLPIPDLRGGKPAVVSAPCSEELRRIVDSLVARAEALRQKQVDPRVDNMLLITADGRKAALDLRLHHPELPDHPDSKVNQAVRRIWEIWAATTEQRSAQLVFCDLSTPSGRGFSIYHDIRNKLVHQGIPDAEMAFIQDFESDTAKSILFRKVRSGKVRVLFGSTQKMGSGTNVQERLIALHHLDAPWRPADVEQREGRILRQGNTNPEVQIFRYVTESSFDAYMWQTLETKAKFIAQVMTGESDLRRIEDVDGCALTYAEVKAIASGNPLVIEKASLDAEIGRLSRLATQHRETQFNLRRSARHHCEDLPRLEHRLENLHNDLLLRQDTRGDRFVIELDGQTIKDRGMAGELINRWGEKIRGRQMERAIGRIGGLELWAIDVYMRGPDLLLKGAGSYAAKFNESAHGTMRSIEHTLHSLDELAEDLDRNILETRKRIDDLVAQAEQPFEYETRLLELLVRQQAITDALDLTKNQAPSIESDSVPEADEPECALREMGFPYGPGR